MKEDKKRGSIVPRFQSLAKRKLGQYIIQKGVGDIIFFAALGGGTFLVSRDLPQGEFGYYGTFLIILNMMLVVFDFGFRNAAVKFISAETDPQKKRILAGFANKTKVVILLGLSVFFYLLIFLFRRSLSGPFLLLFIHLPAIGALKSLILQFDSVLRARNLWVRSGFLLNIQPLSFIAAILIFGGRSHLTLERCLNFYLITILMGAVLGFCFVYRFQTVRSRWDPALFKKFLRFGLPLSFNSALWTGSDKIDKFVIFKYLPLSEIGNYNVAYFIIRLIAQINSPLQGVLFTHFSNVTVRQGIRQIRKYYYSSLAAAGILVFFIFSFSDLLFSLLYGDKYLTAQVLLKVLSLSLVFRISLVPLSYFIIFIDGKTWKVAVCQLIGFLVNLAASFILVPGYGAIGAALATVVTFASIFVGFSLFIVQSVENRPTDTTATTVKQLEVYS